MSKVLLPEYDGFVGYKPLLPKAWKERLRKLYSEKQRHYHTSTHISRMLRLAEEHTDALSEEDRKVIKLAIHFHDAVYDPAAKNGQNEIDSATLFEDFCNHGTSLPESTRKKVITLILATIKHEIPAGYEDDPCSKLFLDFDLEILGSDEDTYDKYCKNVRKEYFHLADEEWKVGRSAVMNKFLARERLYFSEPGSGWEQAARSNISRELLVLQAE